MKDQAWQQAFTYIAYRFELCAAFSTAWSVPLEMDVRIVHPDYASGGFELEALNPSSDEQVAAYIGVRPKAHSVIGMSESEWERQKTAIKTQRRSIVCRLRDLRSGEIVEIDGWLGSIVVGEEVPAGPGVAQAADADTSDGSNGMKMKPTKSIQEILAALAPVQQAQQYQEGWSPHR